MKVAVVVQRYGADISGGAEFTARRLDYRLLAGGCALVLHETGVPAGREYLRRAALLQVEHEEGGHLCAPAYLGLSMAQVAVIVNPQRFIIGGGVAAAGEFLLERVREAFRAHALERAGEGVAIVAAELGNNAGVIGAAGLVREL